MTKFKVKFIGSYETEGESTSDVNEKFSEMIDESGLRGVISIDYFNIKVKTNKMNKTHGN